MGSSSRTLSRPLILLFASRGSRSSWRMAVFERRTLRFVKGDELLGLEDALLSLVQETGLRVPNETAEELVVGLSLRGKAFEPVSDLRGYGDRGEPHDDQ